MDMNWAQLASTPAAPAPEGVTSNLVDPESRAWTVALTIGITLPPAIILVALRIYARLGLARKLGFDDCKCDPTSCGRRLGPELTQSCHRYLRSGYGPSTRRLLFELVLLLRPDH
jgi:hypothetical protein